MDAWCSGGVPMQASVATVTAKSSSAAPTTTAGMARLVETPGHDDLRHPHVAQDGQHLGAVHRGDALVPREHEVVGPHADLGTTSRAGCPSLQAAVADVARTSRERWLADRPPARGR